MKRSIAKLILLTSIVLSAFSVAGSIATVGKDGPNPAPCGTPTTPPCYDQPLEIR
jgi:hypothetical protein